MILFNKYTRKFTEMYKESSLILYIYVQRFIFYMIVLTDS